MFVCSTPYQPSAEILSAAIGANSSWRLTSLSSLISKKSEFRKSKLNFHVVAFLEGIIGISKFCQR